MGSIASEASKASKSSPRRHYDDDDDAPAEETSRPTPTRMAVVINNISRPQSRAQSRKHNKTGAHGDPSTKTNASKQFNTPYVVSNSDKGPSKRIANPSTPVTEHHTPTFLPSNVVRNVKFKMERPGSTWGPDIFTGKLCDDIRSPLCC